MRFSTGSSRRLTDGSQCRTAIPDSTGTITSSTSCTTILPAGNGTGCAWPANTCNARPASSGTVSRVATELMPVSATASARLPRASQVSALELLALGQAATSTKPTASS